MTYYINLIDQSRGYENAIKKIIDEMIEKLTDRELLDVFRKACSSSNIHVVDILNKIPSIKVSNKSFPFWIACSDGNIVLAKYLIENTNLEPADNDNDGFITACKNGHLELVVYLTSIDDISPEYNDNDALKIACMYGHLEVVKHLLTIPEVKKVFYREGLKKYNIRNPEICEYLTNTFNEKSKKF